MRTLILFLMCIVPVLSADATPVEFIIFAPKDQLLSQKDVDRAKASIRASRLEAHGFFCAEMKGYGFKEKTFRYIEKIEVIWGKKNLEAYKSVEEYAKEIPFSENVKAVFVAGGEEIGDPQTEVGTWWHRCDNEKCDHLVFVPLAEKRARSVILAHELTHAFVGSYHLSDDEHNHLPGHPLMRAKIPSKFMGVHKLKEFSLTFWECRWLNDSSHLNARDIIECIPRFESGTMRGGYVNSEAHVRFTFKVSSDDPLKQAYISAKPGYFLGWKTLEGHEDTAVFLVPKADLLDAKKVSLGVINSEGGIMAKNFDFNMPIIEDISLMELDLHIKFAVLKKNE